VGEEHPRPDRSCRRRSHPRPRRPGRHRPGVAAFCLAASGIYLVNDARDVEGDRAHPTKCRRPIASGELPLPLAWGAAVLLLLAAPVVASFASWPLVVVLVVYEGVQLAYCFGLKHEPVLELAVVAPGFLLRAIAGGAASGIPLSQWFLVSAGFGSLFMAAGKRYAEARLVEGTGRQTRRVLDRYTPTYLRFAWTLSAGVLVTAYSLWAFEVREATGSVWSVVSLVPFVIAVLRYAVDVDSGNAGEPEEIVFRDRPLLLMGLLWAVSLGVSVYA
jgi:decaprenyl-phosphate phosphoribosyltransferase